MCNIKTPECLGFIEKILGHPVAAENFEMRGRNTILSCYHNRFDTKLSNGVCTILCITCAFPACVAELDKYWFPNISP